MFYRLGVNDRVYRPYPPTGQWNQHGPAWSSWNSPGHPIASTTEDPDFGCPFLGPTARRSRGIVYPSMNHPTPVGPTARFGPTPRRLPSLWESLWESTDASIAPQRSGADKTDETDAPRSTTRHHDRTVSHITCDLRPCGSRRDCGASGPEPGCPRRMPTAMRPPTAAKAADAKAACHME